MKDMEFISMTCRNCGGKLSISKDADQCICQNCGSEYLVTFSDNTFSIKKLSETLQGIHNSTDKTAAELALKRIREEKKKLHDESRIQAVILNFSHRNSDKYHLDVDEALGSKIGLYDFSSSANIDDLVKLRTYCERAIQCEKQRLIPDKFWLTTFEDGIRLIDALIPKLKILLEQEEYHKKAVAS